MTTPAKIKIFISYCRQDESYLEKASLLGFLRGLEQDNIEFWTDKQIKTGEFWDNVIKTQLRVCDIALVLVSQAFLDSNYCRDVEIKTLLADTKYLFPLILSPCNWQRHDWLASRQFLPTRDETIEEHYTEPGARKRLFLKIREQLSERAELIRQAGIKPITPTKSTLDTAAPSLITFAGETKLAFCERLGADWTALADSLQIKPSEQATFNQGHEPRALWVWLENRRRLSELPALLARLNRADLAQLFFNT
jgi:hypothetical protein